MDSRERLRRAYAHEEMDRPGVYSRTGFPTDDPTYDRLKAYLAEHSDLKVPWRGRAFETPYTTHTHREPHSADWVRVVTTLETPAGPLTSTRLESLRGKPGLHETFFIKTREDALAYLSLPLPALRGDVASFGETDRRIGDRGIVDVALGYNPAGHVAAVVRESRPQAPATRRHAAQSGSARAHPAETIHRLAAAAAREAAAQ